MSGKGLIAVHVGAGYHSPTNSQLYKNVCKEACLQAIALLRQKKSALEVVTAAVVSLENSPWTNAGIGSNLTIKGTVECDASVMDGDTLMYGAVGAMPGVKNPVLVAENLLKTQLKGNMSLGRIPPSTMVGTGATDWAKRKGIATVDHQDLITENTYRTFFKHKRKLDLLEEESPKDKKVKLDNGAAASPQANGNNDVLQDTVGAVCIDDEGGIASAVSSGGIVLKQPGRVGQAALYGCGCWAEKTDDQIEGVAVTTSGCGEHITRTFLAKECADSLRDEEDTTLAMHNVFHHKFLRSPFLREVAHTQKLGGALALKSEDTEEGLGVEVMWAHTTDSMCLAYMGTTDTQPKALVSRLPENKSSGKSFIIQSKSYLLSSESASDEVVQAGDDDENDASEQAHTNSTV